MQVRDDNATESAALLPDRIQRRSTSSALEEGSADASAGESTAARREGKAIILREWTLPQCLCSLDYWILWSGLFIGIGSGFTLLNNFGAKPVYAGLRRLIFVQKATS